MFKVGIIGGSGLYQMEGLKSTRQVLVTTPFGDPSDRYVCGMLDGVEVVFLPRHGRGHRFSPSEVNYRANIFGMKKLGVGALLSVSACGSLKEKLRPLDFVIPDQFVDRTRGCRAGTFFAEGIVAHVSLAQPISPEIADVLFACCRELKLPAHKGGTYLNMEGPQFSTRAESLLYRQWGMDIIGMTNATEARLAREAEIAYATLAAITDYDCWHAGQASVTVEMVLENLKRNVENAKKILRLAIPRVARVKSFAAHDALKYALITDPASIPLKTKKKLKILIKKYIS